MTDCANSPLLVEGLLVMYCFDHLWAWDTKTGQLRWKAESKAWFRHAMGTPVVLRLPDPKGGPAVTAVFCWPGDLVRASDGKVLLSRLAKIQCAALVSDGRDRLFADVGTGPAEGGAKTLAPDVRLLVSGDVDGSVGVRFALDAAGAVTASRLWFNEKNTGYKCLGPYPLLHDGRLWTQAGDVVDPVTGKAVAARPRKLGSRSSLAYNGMILAGGRLYGLPHLLREFGDLRGDNLSPVKAGGERDAPFACLVAEAADKVALVAENPVQTLPGVYADPAKRAQVVAQTGRSANMAWYGWHDAYSAPFASGNRLFIRTFDYLYCFGDPAKPFTPSKAFEEER